jgi:hypothetical protein
MKVKFVIFYLLVLTFAQACLSDKIQSARKLLFSGDPYEGWITLAFNQYGEKEEFSLRLPPGTEGIECDTMSEKAGKIFCAVSRQLWVSWRSNEVKGRILHLGIESYKTDHLNLKQDRVAYYSNSWRDRTLASFSKKINGTPFHFMDITDSLTGKVSDVGRRRVASFETKNRFFASFSFAESQYMTEDEASVQHKDWMLEPVMEKILSSIVFNKDLGTPVEMPK